MYVCMYVYIVCMYCMYVCMYVCMYLYTNQDVLKWHQVSLILIMYVIFPRVPRKHKVLPDIWSLREWSNWLTPSSFGRKRFDTMFYICAMDCLPFIKHDEKEMSHAVWSTPKQLVIDHVHGNMLLAPPQLYEMSRLLRFERFLCVSHAIVFVLKYMFSLYVLDVSNPAGYYRNCCR